MPLPLMHWPPGPQSVSKLHAHFARAPDGSTRLSDAGSRNGTRLNDSKLVAGKAKKTHHGDTITFGAVSVSFIDSGGLYDLVSKQLVPLKTR